jgi:PAS domain S-box-containing protein
MAWLSFGVLYSIAYVLGGWLLRGHAAVVPWFRIGALLVPPLAGVVVIVRRRRAWTGCHWLFWATIALGLMMSAIGVVGWTADDLLFGYSNPWIAWHAVFALFGGVAPLFALLAQPHRGTRENVTATTAVDIAGIAVLTGFLYSHFVVGPEASGAGPGLPSASLLMLSGLQQLLACVGMAAAALIAKDPAWAATYRRLAIGLLVNFAALTLSNAEIWRGLYQSASVYDIIWILPFAFYPWAAAHAPASADATPDRQTAISTPSRPWVIFGGLALIPLIDYGLTTALPGSAPEPFHDLSTAVSIVSVLPLLMARLAVERAEVRQADTRLRLLEAAIEQADEHVLIVTRDQRIQHANRAFCRAMGYSQAELTRLSPGDLLADQSLPTFDHINEAVMAGRVWRGTLVHRRKDGSTFQSSSVIVPLSDDHGRVMHIVGVERDISDEMRLREQLIHTERLSAVGQLVSGVAHELNNPLQSVLGFTELLIEAEREPQTRRDLEQVRSEAIRAGKIVRNLLAFVRRSSPERFIANLNDIVRTTLALRSYEFGSANITLEEKYADTLPAVCVNREEIQQVILNLVLNAEYALRTGHQGGVLAVRTDIGESGAIVEVRDDGLGVAPELTGRVFEPFFSTKDVGEGTGLGLSIALGIAEAHGGSLTLVPTTSGACFRLTLPVVSAEELAAPPFGAVADTARRAPGHPRAGAAGGAQSS